MLKEPESLLTKFGQGFWKLWGKIWWLIALAFISANYWGVRQYGWLGLLRFWSGAFILMGLVTLLYCWRALVRARDSENWPCVEGQITRSEVEAREERTTDSISGHPDYITYYYPRIEYEYVWAGVTYQSNKILFVNVNYSHTDAEATVARYPVSSLVKVYVCPDNPRLAVLEPGLAGKGEKYGKAILVGLVFAVAGAASWFLLPLWLK